MSSCSHFSPGKNVFVFVSICTFWHGVIRCNNTFNLLHVCMLIYVLACHSAFTYTGMVKAVHSCLSVLMPILCVCVCVVSGSRLLQPAQVCDMLRGLILVLCFSMMHYVDYSMMYHLIRGQSVIKLYIIYNMLEVTHTSHIDVSLYFDHMLICKDAAVAPVKTLHLRQTRILTLLFTV